MNKKKKNKKITLVKIERKPLFTSITKESNKKEDEKTNKNS